MSESENVTVDLVTILEEVLDILEETEDIAIESTPPSVIGDDDEEDGIAYVIPDRMVIIMEPKDEVDQIYLLLSIWSVINWDVPLTDGTSCSCETGYI